MYAAATRRKLADALAAAFLAGGWDEPGLAARGREALAPSPRWLLRLVRDVLGAYHRPPADRPRELAAYIEGAIEQVEPGAGRRAQPPRVRRWFLPERAMGRMRWPVPELTTAGDLAIFLALQPGPLAWLADVRGLERRVDDERLRNYRYLALPRPGGVPRLIERPKARLMAAQRRILHGILAPLPPHDAAHGFVRGRSARSHAGAHVGRRVVLRFDLEDFFAAVPARRIYAIFRAAGYPEAVAHVLAGLATNAVPGIAWDAVEAPQDARLVYANSRLRRALAVPHLPQGAPTSPALANLAAFGLDTRVAALAAAWGASYTRYADDLVLSGDGRLLRGAAAVRATVRVIAAEEGFRVNERKSQLMTDAGRQRVAGIVVNDRLNVTRSEYDLLKAILHNAARHGPAAQNRHGVPDFRAHLLGRIAWVESLHDPRGARLMERFERIDWEISPDHTSPLSPTPPRRP